MSKIIGICIDDKNSTPKGEKLTGLTENKKYELEQSENYDNYYDVKINDLKEKQSYRKERFRIMDEERKICYQESEKCPQNENGKGADNKICGNQYPTGTDFELEYFKLKEENSRLKIKLNTQNIIIKEYEGYKKENEELKEFKTKYKRMENQFNNNNKLLEEYSIKITLFEQDNKEYKQANEGLAAESKERFQTIKKMQRIIEENNMELTEELKDRNKRIEEENILLNKSCHELSEQLENELGRNRILTEKLGEITPMNDWEGKFKEAKQHIEVLEKEIDGWSRLESTKEKRLKEVEEKTAALKILINLL